MTTPTKITVNGTEYNDLESMPPDVRQVAEEAMRKVNAGDPTVVKNEIKLSFHVTGPGLSFHKTLGNSGSPSRGPTPQLTVITPDTQMTTQMTPNPIEPSSTEGGVRVALLIGGCVLVGLVFWFLSRPH